MRRKYHRKEQRKAFFDETIATYGDCCMICGEHVRHLVIDHDHETGYMRGVLCSKHNAGLGHFDDDPTLLRKAATYLETRITIIDDVAPFTDHPKKAKLLVSEAIIAAINDLSFGSDRKRAHSLAPQLNKTEGAVRSRISRARKRLKKHVITSNVHDSL